ncbi:MAG: hypothetical protein SPF21_00535 [Candidatus Methanomethylophilaceae archaeon]|nr:hypothetical protein [Candidatus Methanomethylophilaceae archaeon]
MYGTAMIRMPTTAMISGILDLLPNFEISPDRDVMSERRIS